MGVVDSNKRPIWNVTRDNTGKPVLQLMGYDVEITQVAPKLSQTAVSTTMAVLGALNPGVVVARSPDLEIAQSTEVKFAEDQTAFRGITRRDIGLADASAICQLVTAAS